MDVTPFAAHRPSPTSGSRATTRGQRPGLADSAGKSSSSRTDRAPDAEMQRDDSAAGGGFDAMGLARRRGA
ncbi:hypothetical protein ACFC4G_07935 [Streptomyces sp. NPDC056002]|uniref:hypothetical protein n=1 Tax=unclassified Streptomyces TaxID=2593676 RepID=UPI0035D9EEB6